MKLEKLKENNRVYNPREALVYFIISSNNAVDKKLTNLIISLDNELSQNIDNGNILEKVDFKYLQNIKNHWNLSKEEVKSYGNIVLSNLYGQKESFELDTIMEEFIYVMKMFSPDEVVELVKNKQMRKNIRNGGIYYSPEQILECMIVSVIKVFEKNLDSLMLSFKEVMIQNVTNLNTFKKYSKDKSINKWNLTLEQAIAYAYIVFEIIIRQVEDISKIDIKPIFLFSMELRSPEMAEIYFNSVKSNV